MLLIDASSPRVWAAPSVPPVQNPVNNLPSETPNQSIYRLGPGDQIEIVVFEYPEMSGPKIISPTGTITLPIAGVITVAGLTPEQLSQGLQVTLRRWLKNPIVTIGVTQFRPLLVTISGEVQRPGPIQMRAVPIDSKAENPGSLPSLSAAIIAAGGITRHADIRTIMLRRNGQTQAINLWQGLVSEQATIDQLLQDGDAVFIPKATTTGIDRQLLAKSTLAPKSIRVRVVGEVKKPGEIELSPNSTIASAIASAGGPTEKAKLNKVALVRLDDNGAIQEQQINLEKLIDDNPIQEGDVVIVPKSKSFSILDIAGQAVPPLGILLNLLR